MDGAPPCSRPTRPAPGASGAGRSGREKLMTRSCLVITAPTVRDLISSGRSALRKGCDLVELRLDHLSMPTAEGVRQLGSVFGRKGIATLRSVGQGGKWRGPRRDLLHAAAAAGFGFLDVEATGDRARIPALRGIAGSARTKVIASHHFRRGRPPGAVRAMLDRCCSMGEVGKVAVVPGSVSAAMDLVEMGRELRRRGRRFILIGMGDRGRITRALAADMGCEVQYLRPEAGGEAAPGQLSLSEWKRLAGRRRRIVTGLVGKPLGRSVSMPMQNAGFRAAGVRGIYLPFEAASERDLRRLLEEPGLRGLNVTMPYKEEIVRLLDRCDPEATRLGAVNTILLDGGAAIGFNTDTYGFRRLLELKRVRKARRALVVGAGGAARAVIHVLLDGAADEVCVTNRSLSRAQGLLRWAGGGVSLIPTLKLRRAGPFDLVVNCTPLGAAGGAGPGRLLPELMGKEVTLIDLVYNPARTPTMAEAERRGARAIGGLEMLVQQGARSFEIWTGERPPLRAMRQAAGRAVRPGPGA